MLRVLSSLAIALVLGSASPAAAQRGGVQTVDFSAFASFGFESGCTREVGDVHTLQLFREDQGIALVDLSVVAEREPGDVCAGNVCAVPLPSRVLTAIEEEIVVETFGAVTYGDLWEGWCAAALICKPHLYSWDAESVNGHICLPPTLEDDSQKDVLALLERLRRGSEDCNDNGRPDAEDIESGVLRDGDGDGVPDGCVSSAIELLRGDCNDDGGVDVSDGVCVLNWLFLGTDEPGCVAATNANGDTRADLADAVWVLNHLFTGGPEPVAPFPDCGKSALEVDVAMGCATAPRACR